MALWLVQNKWIQEEGSELFSMTQTWKIRSNHLSLGPCSTIMSCVVWNQYVSFSYLNRSVCVQYYTIHKNQFKLTKPTHQLFNLIVLYTTVNRLRSIWCHGTIPWSAWGQRSLRWWAWSGPPGAWSWWGLQSCGSRSGTRRWFAAAPLPCPVVAGCGCDYRCSRAWEYPLASSLVSC